VEAARGREKNILTSYVKGKKCFSTEKERSTNDEISSEKAFLISPGPHEDRAPCAAGGTRVPEWPRGAAAACCAPSRAGSAAWSAPRAAAPARGAAAAAASCAAACASPAQGSPSDRAPIAAPPALPPQITNIFQFKFLAFYRFLRNSYEMSENLSQKFLKFLTKMCNNLFYISRKYFSAFYISQNDINIIKAIFYKSL